MEVNVQGKWMYQYKVAIIDTWEHPYAIRWAGYTCASEASLAACSNLQRTQCSRLSGKECNKNTGAHTVLGSQWQEVHCAVASAGTVWGQHRGRGG